MKLKKLIKKIRNNLPLLVAILFFLISLSVSFYYISYKRGQWEKDVRANLLETLIGKKSKLEKALYSRIYYTKGVAAYVSVNPDLTDKDFYGLAKQLIKQDSVISTMSLSPNCILSAIYPLKGHEAAIGLDLLQHPERKEIVEKTIETQKTFVAGPVELVEGGIAFISYTPIFNRLPGHNGEFWGMTDIVIYKDPLLSEAGFSTVDRGFRFALKGKDGTGENGAIFWGDEDVFNQNPVTINIDLPDGNWVLASCPVQGWGHFLNQDQTLAYLLLISSVIISVLFWLVIRSQLKIRTNEKELKAIFNSLHNLIVEFSSKGEYLKIAPTNKNLLYRPERELIGKTLHEIFDKDKADLLLNAIQKCLKTKDLVIVEYPLIINKNKHWFSARISYRSDESVIFSAYDITEKKKDEENLRRSEQQLKESNATKDKFFSIIAHDLRTPLANFQSILELLELEFDNFDDVQKKKFIRSMHSSAINLNGLLENLLEWTLSQKGQLKLIPEHIALHHIISSVLEQTIQSANKKEILIENLIDKKTVVFADKHATNTVIRNLISNAIKFSKQKGEIYIRSEAVALGSKSFYRISIADNGIGISEERLNDIFRIDVQTSTEGTYNEKGSGLGLILCKELIEKQGGQIEIHSQIGKGTTVSITLPA